MEHENLRLALELCKDTDLDIVKDMASFYGRKGSLSENQERFLQTIINRNQPLDPAWVEEYRSTKRELMSRAVEFYCHPSHRDYFQKAVGSFKADPQWVPSIDLYKNMTENRYFVAYVKACNLKPKFQHGDLVCRDVYQNQTGVIIDVQPPSPAHPSYGYEYLVKFLTYGTVAQYSQKWLRKIKEKKNET